jgi:hypothetical protein
VSQEATLTGTLFRNLADPWHAILCPRCCLKEGDRGIILPGGHLHVAWPGWRQGGLSHGGRGVRRSASHLVQMGVLGCLRRRPVARPVSTSEAQRSDSPVSPTPAFDSGGTAELPPGPLIQVPNKALWLTAWGSCWSQAAKGRQRGAKFAREDSGCDPPAVGAGNEAGK